MKLIHFYHNLFTLQIFTFKIVNLSDNENHCVQTRTFSGTDHITVVSSLVGSICYSTKSTISHTNGDQSAAKHTRKRERDTRQQAKLRYTNDTGQFTNVAGASASSKVRRPL